MGYCIGIDLGGSSIKAVTVTAEGQTLTQTNVAFDIEAKLDWAGKIGELVKQIERESNDPASHIGLSAPGLAAADGRSIAHMPERLEGLEGLNWTKYLRRPGPVPVLNDADTLSNSILPIPRS